MLFTSCAKYTESEDLDEWTCNVRFENTFELEKFLQFTVIEHTVYSKIFKFEKNFKLGYII